VGGVASSPACFASVHYKQGCRGDANSGQVKQWEHTVLTGFMATWFFAASPMRRSESVKPTYEGVVRLPWSLAIISTRSFCHTPTHLQGTSPLGSVGTSSRVKCTRATLDYTINCKRGLRLYTPHRPKRCDWTAEGLPIGAGRAQSKGTCCRRLTVLGSLQPASGSVK
jgi:hypothetical protein